MDAHFERVYVLMIEYVGGNLQLAKSGDQNSGKIVVAREGNQHLLREIGDKLMDDKLIVGYQVLVTFEPPVRCYEVEQIQPH